MKHERDTPESSALGCCTRATTSTDTEEQVENPMLRPRPPSVAPSRQLPHKNCNIEPFRNRTPRAANSHLSARIVQIEQVSNDEPLCSFSASTVWMFLAGLGHARGATSEWSNPPASCRYLRLAFLRCRLPPFSLISRVRGSAARSNAEPSAGRSFCVSVDTCPVSQINFNTFVMKKLRLWLHRCRSRLRHRAFLMTKVNYGIGVEGFDATSPKHIPPVVRNAIDNFSARRWGLRVVQPIARQLMDSIRRLLWFPLQRACPVGFSQALSFGKIKDLDHAEQSFFLETFSKTSLLLEQLGRSSSLTESGSAVVLSYFDSDGCDGWINRQGFKFLHRRLSLAMFGLEPLDLEGEYVWWSSLGAALRLMRLESHQRSSNPGPRRFHVACEGLALSNPAILALFPCFFRPSTDIIFDHELCMPFEGFFFYVMSIVDFWTESASGDESLRFLTTLSPILFPTKTKAKQSLVPESQTPCASSAASSTCSDSKRSHQTPHPPKKSRQQLEAEAVAALVAAREAAQLKSMREKKTIAFMDKLSTPRSCCTWQRVDLTGDQGAAWKMVADVPQRNPMDTALPPSPVDFVQALDAVGTTASSSPIHDLGEHVTTSKSEPSSRTAERALSQSPVFLHLKSMMARGIKKPRSEMESPQIQLKTMLISTLVGRNPDSKQSTSHLRRVGDGPKSRQIALAVQANSLIERAQLFANAIDAEERLLVERPPRSEQGAVRAKLETRPFSRKIDRIPSSRCVVLNERDITPGRFQTVSQCQTAHDNSENNAVKSNHRVDCHIQTTRITLHCMLTPQAALKLDVASSSAVRARREQVAENRMKPGHTADDQEKTTLAQRMFTPTSVVVDAQKTRFWANSAPTLGRKKKQQTTL